MHILSKAVAFALLASGAPVAHGEELSALSSSISSVKRLSVSGTGQQGSDNSWEVAISPDGRYVAFDSWASNLVSGDTNLKPDVFLKDLRTGKLTRISVSPSGKQSNDESWDPAFSGDGRYVTFQSRASNLVAGDTNGKMDIFVYSIEHKTLVRASTSASGAQANGTSMRPSLSSDGSMVVFDSDANNLVQPDKNKKFDVFLKNLRTGEVTLVSRTPSVQANLDSLTGVISPDGKSVAYMSYADNLIEDDYNNTGDIFVTDISSGQTTLASSDTKGNIGDDFSFVPEFAPNGDLYFSSGSHEITPHDTNKASDVFLKSLSTGALTRVSVNASGGQANSGSIFGMPSANGKYLAFISKASNLTPHHTGSYVDVFVKSLETGTVICASSSAAGVLGNGSSANVLSNLDISADGKTVVFSSDASNLVPGDTNRRRDVFLVKLK